MAAVKRYNLCSYATTGLLFNRTATKPVDSFSPGLAILSFSSAKSLQLSLFFLFKCKWLSLATLQAVDFLALYLVTLYFLTWKQCTEFYYEASAYQIDNMIPHSIVLWGAIGSAVTAIRIFSQKLYCLNFTVWKCFLLLIDNAWLTALREKERFTLYRLFPGGHVEETLLLANQFCASMIRKDDRALLGEEDTPFTFMESLIGFIEQRYQVASVVPLTTHTFITALTEHHTQHKELLVLCHTLSGGLDGCALRQLLLLAGLVDIMPWNSISEFSAFAAIIYPALQEEELDHIAMNFVSYSGNKISASLVLGFLTWVIIRHKDPLLIHFENQLSEHPCRTRGSMLEVEFAEAVDSLVSLVSDQLCRHLYLQSLIQLQDKENSQQTRKTLPIKRLSLFKDIACYLHTLSHMTALKNSVEQLAQQTAAHTSKPHPPFQPTQSQQKPKLFTMEKAREMANRMKAIAQYK